MLSELGTWKIDSEDSLEVFPVQDGSGVTYRAPMQVKNVSKFQEFSIWGPAVTDPHKIRPCNYTVW